MDDNIFGSGNDPMAETPEATTPTDTSGQKRVMNVFLIVDTSGSMSGDRIGSVNQAIREVIPQLKAVQDGKPGAEIRVALMSFDASAKWITSMPEPVNDFTYANFTANGGTNAGHAFELLSEKMSRKAFMNASGGHYKPLILLLSDGESMGGWESKLDKLRTNSWYKNSARVAIAAGKDATTEEAMRLFEAFASTSDMIIYAHEPDEIKQYILLVTLTVAKTSILNTGMDTTKTPPTNTGGIPNPIAQDTQEKTPDWWKNIKDKVKFPPKPPID
jgi:uncharacterized protein YegL